MRSSRQSNATHMRSLRCKTSIVTPIPISLQVYLGDSFRSKNVGSSMRSTLPAQPLHNPSKNKPTGKPIKHLWNRSPLQDKRKLGTQIRAHAPIVPPPLFPHFARIIHQVNLQDAFLSIFRNFAVVFEPGSEKTEDLAVV